VRFFITAITASAFATTICVSSPLLAETKGSKVQKQQQDAVVEVPRCSKKLGSVTILNGDNTEFWDDAKLAPPQKLLKAIVLKSNCFSVVDRGMGLDAAAKERNLNNQGLGLQRGSNMGQNQIKAADFVLVAEVSSANSNVSGNALGAAVGGAIGGTLGSLIGGIKTQKLEATTVLSLTSVRTSETVASTEGHAAKSDVSFGLGGSIGFGGAVGGGYENTDIGRIVTIAFIDAYTQMIRDMGGLSDSINEAAAPTRSFRVLAPTTMRARPDSGAKVIRALPAGMLLYPTGNKNGVWWEVQDDNDNGGWVLNEKLEAAQ
jgi:curli biogenesis system outer membrane secretion channel CsgG